jgi:hypothetical protein
VNMGDNTVIKLQHLVFVLQMIVLVAPCLLQTPPLTAKISYRAAWRQGRGVSVYFQRSLLAWHIIRPAHFGREWALPGEKPAYYFMKNGRPHAILILLLFVQILNFHSGVRLSWRRAKIKDCGLLTSNLPWRLVFCSVVLRSIELQIKTSRVCTVQTTFNY